MFQSLWANRSYKDSSGTATGQCLVEFADVVSSRNAEQLHGKNFLNTRRWLSVRIIANHPNSGKPPGWSTHYSSSSAPQKQIPHGSFSYNPYGPSPVETLRSPYGPSSPTKPPAQMPPPPRMRPPPTSASKAYIENAAHQYSSATSATRFK